MIEVEIDGVTVRVGRGSKDVDCGAACVEGRRMIDPTGAVRVMVATRPVDFRKGAKGLAALVRETMTAGPFSGAVYVFRAKRADRIKLIFLGWHRPVPVCQTAGRRHLPLAEDRGRRDAFVSGAIVGTAGGAGLASRS
jgi:IS66 Orf2 like protein